MTIYRLLLLLATLIFTASSGTAQSPTQEPQKKQLTYHSVGVEVLSAAVLREPRISYEYRKNQWGIRGIIGYRISTYDDYEINYGPTIDYDLYRARRGNYFSLGVNHYFPRSPRHESLINFLLGLQVAYHHYRLYNRCLLDDYDSEATSYRILDRQYLERMSARLIMGLSVSSSLVKRISILIELYLGVGPGVNIISEEGTLVSEVYYLSCFRIPDGAVVEPLDTRYQEGVIPFELGLRLNYLVKKRLN